MKHLCKTGLLALLISMNGLVYGLNPVPGWYGGILLGANYTPSNNFSFPTPIPDLNLTGAINYSVLGQIGGQFGYRLCKKYRLEGQFFYNNSPYTSLELGNVTIFSPSINTTGYRIEGSTDTGAIMLNGYYDFFTSDRYKTLVPYVGIGGGYAYASNNFKLYYQEVNVEQARIKSHFTSLAGQLIVGLSSFLDDFSFFGIDGRYFITSGQSDILNARVQFYSINLSFNGAFNLV